MANFLSVPNGYRDIIAILPTIKDDFTINGYEYHLSNVSDVIGPTQ